MLSDRKRIQRIHVKRFIPFFWIALMFSVQACSDGVSVDDAADVPGDGAAGPQIESESNLAVFEDGRVAASGPVQEVSTASFGVAGATFDVTEETAITNASGRSMAITGVKLGMFLEVSGRVVEDGSYVASVARADSTVILCHVPPGNPDRARSLQVGYRSMQAHLNHGDYEGECEVIDSSEEGDQGDVVTSDEDEEGPESEGDEPDVPKAVICHVPPGNPDHAHTISIDSLDVQDHLDHGDHYGECESVGGAEEGDDGQGVETGGTGEPGEEGDEEPAEEKVLVCHIPPGNPSRARTISVDPEDVQDHLDHGDVLGECEG